MPKPNPDFVITPCDAQESYSQRKAREEAHRALPAEDQPHMVVFFGMLSYRIVSIHDTEAEAEAALAAIQARCDAANAALAKFLDKPWHERLYEPLPETISVPSMTRQATSGDFDVRTQADLDALTDAIMRSNEATAHWVN